ncbi:putative phosphatidate phosphatase [Cochliomyia hominivorax]
MFLQKISKCLLMRLIMDWLITTVLLAMALNFFKIFGKAKKRGFFCDDESLKYPYQEDTVSGSMLMALTLYVPLLLIAIGEAVLFLVRRFTTAEDQGYMKALLKLHHNMVTFLSGFALHACFVHLAKLTIGRLRPHFFEVCKPSLLKDGSTCDNPSNHGTYIVDYTCQASTDATQDMLTNIHISFPSGHASYIFYGMIFLILYIQRFAKTLREQGIDVGLVRLVVQMLCALLAWFVAVSRVSDYKHHWSDVLVGILLGTSVAIVVSLYVRQQLKSVNSFCPEGVKSSNISDTTSTTTFTTVTATNKILVP